MSLKQFHVIFIVASILISFGFAYWAYLQFNESQISGYFITSIISGLVGILLFGYEINFIRKNTSID